MDHQCWQQGIQLASFTFTYPLSAGVFGTQLMTSQPVSSSFSSSFFFFFYSPLPSGTWRTPDLSIPWCCLPTSISVRLVFFPPVNVPCKMVTRSCCWPIVQQKGVRRRTHLKYVLRKLVLYSTVAQRRACDVYPSQARPQCPVRKRRMVVCLARLRQCGCNGGLVVAFLLSEGWRITFLFFFLLLLFPFSNASLLSLSCDRSMVCIGLWCPHSLYILICCIMSTFLVQPMVWVISWIFFLSIGSVFSLWDGSVRMTGRYWKSS